MYSSLWANLQLLFTRHCFSFIILYLYLSAYVPLMTREVCSSNPDNWKKLPVLKRWRNEKKMGMAQLKKHCHCFVVLMKHNYMVAAKSAKVSEALLYVDHKKFWNVLLQIVIVIWKVDSQFLMVTVFCTRNRHFVPSPVKTWSQVVRQ